MIGTYLRDFSSTESGDDAFDQRIASQLDALDNLPIDQTLGIPFPVYSIRNLPCRTGENISKNLSEDRTMDVFVVNGKIGSASIESKPVDESCDDLVDLNVEKPENDKKVGMKDKGPHSDEVRIMEKVLGPKVSNLYPRSINF